jgi:hypothetical protein
MIDYRLGEAHFMAQLTDADRAQNNAGWQWSVGCGCSAQPYFRMFNPVTQAERHDPEGTFVRRWVPELARLPDRYLHRPWEAPLKVAAAAKVRLGVDYPAPIVEHRAARERFLSVARKHLRGQTLGAALAMVLALLWCTPTLANGVELDVEAGAAFVSRNDARIPGAGGTTLSLVNDLDADTVPAFRLRLGYRWGGRHFVGALYAPLTVQARGSVPRDIEFAGGSFSANSDLLAVYRFDSYRLTYRYSLVRQVGLDLAVGLTGKIRDAEISLYGEDARRKTNTGFVPLLNLHAAWRPGAGAFGLLLDADALAAPQGRAEDVLLAVTWRASTTVDLRAGYRMLEGGADNDEVYNFAWVQYLVVGGEFRF